MAALDAWASPIAVTQFVENSVTGGIRLNQDRSQQAVNEVHDLINQISGVLSTVGDVPLLSVELGLLSSVVDSFNLPAPPIAPIIDTTFPLPNAILEVTPNFLTETPYLSAMLTQLDSTLMDLVTNIRQSGLNPVIEQQLWDRGREKTSRTAQGIIDGVTRSWARSGWAMPQGDQAEALEHARELQAEQDITESRSIAVAQADLEQKNLQFSLTQAITLQGIMTQLYNALQDRLITAEKERINALLQTNQIGTEVYKTQILAVTSRIEGLVKLYTGNAEVYTSEAKALGERANVQVAIQKNELEYVEKKAEISIEVNKTNLATFLGQKELVLGVLKTIVQTQSQLAAAFGSAVNYSAGISASESHSDSNSNSFSVSISDSTTHSD